MFCNHHTFDNPIEAVTYLPFVLTLTRAGFFFSHSLRFAARSHHNVALRLVVKQLSWCGGAVADAVQFRFILSYFCFYFYFLSSGKKILFTQLAVAYVAISDSVSVSERCFFSAPLWCISSVYIVL